MAPNGILGLADELLQLIVEHLAADPEKSLTVDKRAYLSQESFRPPSSPSPNQAKDLGELRLACRRFSEVVVRQQFGRITTRFSYHGFERLGGISDSAHIAEHVKKFSYMVPNFYTEGKSHLTHGTVATTDVVEAGITYKRSPLLSNRPLIISGSMSSRLNTGFANNEISYRPRKTPAS